MSEKFEHTMFSRPADKYQQTIQEAYDDGWFLDALTPTSYSLSPDGKTIMPDKVFMVFRRPLGYDPNAK